MLRTILNVHYNIDEYLSNLTGNSIQCNVKTVQLMEQTMSQIFHDTLYLNLVREVRTQGAERGDRTKTGTLAVFSRQMRFDLSDGSFPLLMAKSTPLRVILEELFWFLRGETNIRPLLEKNVHIWSEWPYKAYLRKMSLPIPKANSEEWKEGLRAFEQQITTDSGFADEFGELGPVYGSQWRSWDRFEMTMENWDGRNFYTKTEPVDQIAILIESLKRDPESRSHIVNAWNPSEYEWLRANSLPPCHIMFQCHVANGRLSLDLTQRSCDLFLGVPFNIAGYSALLLMLAQVTGLTPGEFIWNGKDIHLYQNHIDQADEMLLRELRPSPHLRIQGEAARIEDFNISHFILEGYSPHPKIPAPVAV